MWRHWSTDRRAVTNIQMGFQEDSKAAVARCRWSSRANAAEERAGGRPAAGADEGLCAGTASE